MRKLEDAFPTALAVVGVHSGKFTRERETESIRDASIRLGALHPIVNDRQFRTWRAYAVRAWPTLVAIDPRGYVVGMRAGEFLAADVVPFVERVIADALHAGTMETSARHITPDSPVTPPGTLAFPGRIAIDGRRVAIADSGHHRLLLGTLGHDGLRMRIDRVVGGDSAGNRDGVMPLFRNPQGLVFVGDTLFVADAGNHSLRAVTVGTGVARTLAGHDAAMRSPWDLAADGDTLIVAMAGTHQLCTVNARTGRVTVQSGSGAEGLHDGPHADAALAQPMGLCLSASGIFFTDSESSAVRIAERARPGAVRTIVGTGLFDFGDVDGVGDDVRLQHPQAIARAPDGRLLVADSYNGALKWIDVERHRAETWIRDLREPGGLAITSNHAYVVETNAHRVTVVDLVTSRVSELAIG